MQGYTELIRVISPIFLALMGGLLAIVAIFKSETLSPDRFASINTLTLAAITGAAGAMSQSGGRSGSQISNSQIDRVEMDNEQP